jgi:hypothetical protein
MRKPSRFFHSHHFLRLAVLAVILLGLTPIVHAPTGITFRSFAHNHCGTCPGGTPITATITVAVTGDALVVDIYGVGTFNSFTVTDGQSNTFTQRVQSIGGCGTCASTYIWTTLTSGSGSDVVTVGTSGATRVFGFTVMDYSNVLGFGVTATDQQDSAGASATSTVTLTNTAGSGSAIVENFFSTGSENGGTSAVLTNNQGQTVRDSGGANPCEFAVSVECESTDFAAPSISFSLGIAQSWTGGVAPYPLSHSALELKGTSTGTITSVTQCYGNCGNPAITLANTNSTHSINWNTSITIFYEFQTTINGFLQNMTTNLAKTYPNGAFAPFIAFYQSQCPLGSTPFSTQCPATQMLGGQAGSASKGRATISGGIQYPVTASSTQWYGVALSFQISPADVNDTNTAFAIDQTGGIIPLTINSASLLNAASKIGIMAFIVGNIVGSLPPPAPGSLCSNNFAQIDCFLPALVNEFCATVTIGCQTASALVWSPIIALIFVAILLGVFKSVFPSSMLSIESLGQVFTIMFLIVVLMFTSLGLLPVFVPLFFFFITAVFLGEQFKHRTA